jgi:hypothetical protein
MTDRSDLLRALTGQADDSLSPESQYQQEMQDTARKNWMVSRPGPYRTPLAPKAESAFRQWVRDNNVNFNPDAPAADYDMRGFYQAAMQGDPNAVAAINPYDHQMHFPDVWKTPAEPSFSRESKYAMPNAPHWQGDRYLVDENGRVVFDAANPAEH